MPSCKNTPFCTLFILEPCCSRTMCLPRFHRKGRENHLCQHLLGRIRIITQLKPMFYVQMIRREQLLQQHFSHAAACGRSIWSAYTSTVCHMNRLKWRNWLLMCLPQIWLIKSMTLSDSLILNGRNGDKCLSTKSLSIFFGLYTTFVASGAAHRPSPATFTQQPPTRYLGLSPFSSPFPFQRFVCFIWFVSWPRS